jgi:hypothetical protein
LWQAISDATASQRLEHILAADPSLGRARSKDGRGAAWWGVEFQNTHALALLVAEGIDAFKLDKDGTGNFPQDLCQADCELSKLKAAVSGAVPKAKQRLEDARKKIADDDDLDFDDEEEIGATSFPGSATEEIDEEEEL